MQMVSHILNRCKLKQVKNIAFKSLGERYPRVSKPDLRLPDKATMTTTHSLDRKFEKYWPTANWQGSKPPQNSSTVNNRGRTAGRATKSVMLMSNFENHGPSLKSDRFEVIANNTPGVVENTCGHGFLQAELCDDSLPWTPCPHFSSFQKKYARFG